MQYSHGVSTPASIMRRRSSDGWVQVFRKAAFKIAGSKGPAQQIVVDNSNLEEFVGRPKFTSDRLYDITPVGVIMGLAWTAMGNELSYSSPFWKWDLFALICLSMQPLRNWKGEVKSLEEKGREVEIRREGNFIVWQSSLPASRNFFSHWFWPRFHVFLFKENSVHAILTMNKLISTLSFHILFCVHSGFGYLRNCG